MNKLCTILLFFLTVNIFAQEKYALVIGNGNYSSFGTLANAINDANDMTDVLQSLGFTVEKILDGNRAQMVEGITRLKNRLSVSKNTYGFVFYAGHGLQFNGINFLVPATADIPNANYLGDMAISVQTLLAELNDAGNELNVIVLDACRDFPAAWSRSMNRGLSVVTNQPADSIIVYATSAGSTASDGTGRNGLFTSHLLTQLRTPGLSVRDVFDRTGLAVSQASGRQQIPAIYSQYFGTAYFGQPNVQTEITEQLHPIQPPEQIPVLPPSRDKVSQSNNERSIFTLGIQAGPGFSTVGSFDGTGNISFYTSIYATYSFNTFFGIQTGLAFSFNNGNQISYYNRTETIKYSVLDIPVLMNFNWYPIKNMLIRFNLGPLFSFVLSDSESFGNYSNGSTYNISFDNSFSIGILGGIGFGYSIGKGNIILDIRAYANTRQTLTAAGNGNYEIRHGSPLLLLGYEFCF